MAGVLGKRHGGIPEGAVLSLRTPGLSVGDGPGAGCLNLCSSCALTLLCDLEHAA